MNKLLLVITFLALGFLTVMGSVDPNNASVWLSSHGQSYDILRGSVMFVLLILLFTNPPRNVILRTLVGFGALGLIGWSGYMTYQNIIQIFDGLALLAAGVTSLVAILEYAHDDEIDRQVVSPNLPTKLRAQTTNR